MRKFRWTMEGEFPSGKMPATFIRLDNRPALDTADVPGTVRTTIYDATVDGKSFVELYAILSSFYNFEGTELKPVTEEQMGCLNLKLYDGLGSFVEEFLLSGVYPKSVNFGEESFSSYEALDIEIEWSYAKFEYKPNGTGFVPMEPPLVTPNLLSLRSWL